MKCTMITSVVDYHNDRKRWFKSKLCYISILMIWRQTILVACVSIQILYLQSSYMIYFFLLIANKLSGTKHGYFSAIIVLITFRYEHGRGLSSIVENILMAHIEFIVL